MSSTTPSITAVYSTMELLDTILHSLAFPDLVRCLRVCKKFAAVIKASRQMQSTLFSQAHSLTALLTRQKDAELDELCVNDGSRYPVIVSPSAATKPETHLPIITLHPILGNDVQPFYGSEATAPSESAVELTLNPRLLFKKPAWQDTYIAQPPPIRVRIGCRARFARNPPKPAQDISARCNIRIERKDGVRLRDVRDAMLAYASAEADAEGGFEVLGKQANYVCPPFKLDKAQMDLVVSGAVLWSSRPVARARVLARENEEYKAWRRRERLLQERSQ